MTLSGGACGGPGEVPFSIPGRTRSERHPMRLPPSQVPTSLVSSTPFEEAFAIGQNIALPYRRAWLSGTS